MKKLMQLFLLIASNQSIAQNVGIGTVSPQATLDVRGNQRFGGANKFINYDSTSGKIGWNNSYLFVPASQYLIQHSASAEGLFYGNGKLIYRGITDTAFYTDWINGNGYFKGLVGIGTTNPGAKLHLVSGKSGYNSGYFPGMVIEGSGNTYLNFLTPDNRESSVLFGKASDGASGGIVYNNLANPNGIQFRTNGNNTTMVLDQAGNVGIGNTAPAEKLDVSGNIKANNFKYTAPKIFYYSIPPAAFTARVSDQQVNTETAAPGAFINDVSGRSIYGLMCPVNLPDNAILISMQIYVDDFSTTQNLKAEFVRVYNNSSVSAGSVSSVGSGGLETQTLTFSSSIVINNLLNAYEISVYPDTGNWPSSQLAITRIVLQYSLSEPQ